MKFTCEKSALLKEIVIAQDIISSRNVLSILSNVLLIADDSTLTIRATDLNVSFVTKIPVEIVAPGTTTVFCEKFLGILRTLPEGEIEFEQEESGPMYIRPVFKKIDFQLKTIASDKFPEFQKASDDQFFEFPQTDFIQMISHTSFAVSDDESRYFMNGVYFEKTDSQLNMIATDGRRLAFINDAPNTELKNFAGIIVPTKILSLVQKLSSREGNLRIAVTEKHIFIEFDNQLVSSTLIEGQFPNYKRVIPDSQDYKLTVNKSELSDALKRVSLFAEQKSRRIYLKVQPGLLTLSSEESEIGV
ncbi:MAG: DNA polymerase III subunit beta, partial [Spirochaetia bacterium]